MTAFDYLVLLIVGVAAVGGFMRGFLQEVLSLAAWVLAAFAIRALHTPLTLALQDHIGTDITTALLAFTLLLLIPFGAVKLIASMVGTTRETVSRVLSEFQKRGLIATQGKTVLLSYGFAEEGLGGARAP